jgi:predicted exporter
MMPASRERVVALSFLVLVGVAGGVGIERLSVSTRITHFLPGGEESREAQLSKVMSETELVRTIIVTVETGERAASAAAVRDLGDRIGAIDGVAWVRSGAGADLEAAVRDLYFPRRSYFLSDGALDLSDAALAERARELKRQLASPASPMIRPTVTEDPLLSFLGQLRRMQAARVGDLDLEDGAFVTRDGRHGVSFLVTEGSPFTGQGPFLERLFETFEAAKRAHPSIVRIEVSAVHRFAIDAEASIKADIARISTISTLLMIGLFLLVFRSLRALLLTYLPVVAGMLASVAVCSAVFPSIHAITLAFGCSMMGVGIDYPIHLVNHHTATGEDRSSTLRAVWPGLLLGALTTIAGLLGLAWTTLPGIQEIAVFSVVGVAAALVTTRIVVPAFMVDRAKPVPFQLRLATVLGRWLDAAVARRGLVMIAWVPAVVIGALGYARLGWKDQLSALNHMDPALLAEDERVRGRVSRMEAGQIVAVIGEDDEDALDKNDRVHRILEEGGHVESFRSIHPFLWSKRLQMENLERLRAAAPRVAPAFEAEGFQAGAFQPFLASLTSTAAPLDYRDLEGSPLGSLVRPFRAELGGEVVLLTFIRGVKDREALERSLAQVEDAFFFDQHRFLADAYGRYRRKTMELMVIGLVAVFALVLARYRRLRLSFAAFIPSLIAAASTLGFLGLLGMEANLMHVVALLLVLSMGVDYGIFMVEHRSPGPARDATLVSIAVASLTTVFSFGMLALSDNPALRALGVAVSIGDVVALVLAPTALGFFRTEAS